MLPAVLLVVSGNAEQLICSFPVLVAGFNFLGFGLGLWGVVDGTSLTREPGEMCSAEFLFWEALLESEEVVFLGIGTGLLSILPVVVVTTAVVVVLSVVVTVVVVIPVEGGCSKSAILIGIVV